MLEKLARHDVQDVSELFSMVDKCVRLWKGVHGIHNMPQR
jgi:hypothetical protein